MPDGFETEGFDRNDMYCGDRIAKETALIFVAHEHSTVFIPVKELNDFVKLQLSPGETIKVSITLNTSSFGGYNTIIKGWYTESGTHRIIVGSSSVDYRLQADVYIDSPQVPQPDLRKLAPSYYGLNRDAFFEVSQEEFEALYGKTFR